MRFWTIFCSVIDNFGDIGICWRLARQLSTEYAIAVDLYVDDLNSFMKICPQVDPTLSEQQIAGVRIILWQQPFQIPSNTPIPEVCIEGLACEVPSAYLQWLNQVNPNALWINLEYLTAESWAEGCHGLASLQPQIALSKYFFFPGFTSKMGGLLREQQLVEKLAAFRENPKEQQQFWQQLGMPDAQDYSLKISIFAYSQQGITAWFNQLAAHPATVLVLVPEGVLAQSLRTSYPELASSNEAQQGNLTIRVLPFMPQPQYDFLLAACDLNFVRGEDSIIRAHWAGRPFIWQIYRQEEQAHLIKLNAFLARMLEEAPTALAQQIQIAHHAWEQELDFASCWPSIWASRAELAAYYGQWQQKLCEQEDLACNLVRFVENKLIMSRNFS